MSSFIVGDFVVKRRWDVKDGGLIVVWNKCVGEERPKVRPRPLVQGRSPPELQRVTITLPSFISYLSNNSLLHQVDNLSRYPPCIHLELILDKSLICFGKY